MTIRTSDRDSSERFYANELPSLGLGQTSWGERFAEWEEFSLARASRTHPPTRGLHLAFGAPSRADVDEFWRVGTGAGYADDGRPGPRPQYSEDCYGAFLLDPDGNSAEAVHGARGVRRTLDHLWIRVADVAAAKRFYATVAPFAGFRLGDDTTDRVQFVGEGSSFSLVSGTPTAHVHLAFGAADDATVEAFHRMVTDAGYRDGGAPGERAVYHPGYFSANVLDPDGNNVELVNHHRA